MRAVWLFLLCLLPGLAGAQVISGTVRDSVTRQPLAFASVFLANTTIGVTTTEQGAFEFPKVPAGTYDIVASYVGYRLAHQTITVGSASQQLLLRLAPAANRLGEVVVRPNPNRVSDYQKFTELFLGRTTFSRQCRIANPADVLLDFDPQANELTASAYKFVQVDNYALGYRIKYYGFRFSTNFTRQVITYYGQPVFEEMAPRSDHQRRHWAANRGQAYQGSLTHFLRGVYEGRVAEEGFQARRLRIVPNQHFGRADSLRRALLRQPGTRSAAEQDSLVRWANVPPAFSLLYRTPRPLDSLRRVSADGQHVFLAFRDHLQVTYLRASPDYYYRLPTAGIGRPAPAPAGRQVSQLILLQPEIEIQPTGHLVNSLAVFTDEYWGFEKMGEFLPLNYLPPIALPHP